MFRPLALVPLALLASCAPGVSYLLGPDASDGATMTVEGTVLAVDPDGDFLLESGGRLLPVDADDIATRFEIGDQVEVRGRVDHDPSQPEAPELDAEAVRLWAQQPEG